MAVVVAPSTSDEVVPQEQHLSKELAREQIAEITQEHYTAEEMIPKLRQESQEQTKQTPCFDIEDFVENASIAEKVALLSGTDFWHTVANERFGIPSIRLSDGPNGVRGTKFFDCIPAACLPCGTALASTWDTALLRRAGVLIGQECIAKGAACWLGPTTNIQRSPLGGRGFESFSEDPFLSGKLGASYINGTQSTGVIATLKHFVANDQEHQRVAYNAQINERALREIYLLPFQIAIADSNPGAIMTAYNRVNGCHVSEDARMIGDILRGEWGWKGLVMSDWFGTYSTSEAINAGLDLEMPGPAKWRGPLAELAISTGKVTNAVLDERVRNILTFVKRASQVPVSSEEGIRDFEEDRFLNRTLAADSVVLLKNDHNILPLSKDIQEVALIGPGVEVANYCGGGSASLEAYYTVSPYQGIINNLGADVKIHYEPGVSARAFLPAISGSVLTTPSNELGCRLRFFREPPSVANREVIHETNASETIWQLMGFTHSRLDRLFYTDVETTLVVPETGSYEFGLAVYGSANLYIDDKLIIENSTIQCSGVFFFGKGTIEEKEIVELTAGQSYKIKVTFGSAPTAKLVKPGVVNFGGGAGRLGMSKVIDEDEAIANAVKIAKENKHTILVAGTSKDFESEGFDRSDMDLPGSIGKLIAAVVAANPDTVVVSQSGTPINVLPWADTCSTHLHAWFGGNEVGNGIADVIFGNINPSGKLPLTFPRRLEDNPSYLNFGSERGRVVYGEGIYVGYRYYEKVGRNVLYPFGHGLSYTQFSYTDLRVSSSEISLTVTNVGEVGGAESIQVYVASDPTTSTIGRPKKELKGFSKVSLSSKERIKVTIPLDKFATAFWDEILQKWVNEKGTYHVLVGSTSADIRLRGQFTVEKTVTWTGL